MNNYWLNSFFFLLLAPSFSFAFILSLSLLYLSFVIVLLLPCFLLDASNYSHNIIFMFLVFLYFVFCSHDAVCLFLCIFQCSLSNTYFLLLRVMLSCGITIFLSSPTSNTFAKTVLVIFIIFTFSLFRLLSVLAWVFFNKNYITVFNIELIKRFHRVKTAFLGICIV